MIFDGTRIENILANFFEKFNLKIGEKKIPYQLAWLHDHELLTVDRQCLAKFSLGDFMKCFLQCWSLVL